MSTRLKAAAVIGIALVSAIACTKQPPTPKVVDTGRPETRSIEAADGLGFNGKEIRQKVDASLNSMDQTGARIDKAVADQQGQTDQAAP